MASKPLVHKVKIADNLLTLFHQFDIVLSTSERKCCKSAW